MGRARATWKHLGAPGAGVVSGVNAASAAGSDGWLGSPYKSAPLPGKMEGEEGWGYKGDHSSLVTPLPFRRLAVQSTHLNHADTHPYNTHFLSFISSTTPDLHSMLAHGTLGIFTSQLKKTLRERERANGGGVKGGERKGLKEKRTTLWKG